MSLVTGTAVSEPPRKWQTVRLRRGWKRFTQGPLSIVGLAWLIILAVVTLWGPQIAPYPLAGNIFDGNQAPSWRHLFGTNSVGQDMLTVCMYGIGYTMKIAVGATATSFAIGVGIGLLAGMAGGWLDHVLMRWTDFMYSFPSFVFAMMLIELTGQGILSVIVMLGITQWAGYSRLARGMTLAIRNSELVESGRAIGASSLFITTRYVFPQVLSSLIVYTAFFLVNIITLEAMLGIFYGVGPQPPDISFGALILLNTPSVLGFPWLLTMPVLVFISLLVALVLCGEGLQTLLSPKGTMSL